MSDKEHRNDRNIYSENCASSRGGPSTSNGGQWQETRREQRHDYGKKRERSRDVDGSDRSFHGKGEHFWEGRRDGYEQPPQQSSQQPISYFNNRDHSFPQYNVMNGNSQWGVNPMDGMAVPATMSLNPNSTALPGVSGMDMSQTNNPAINPYAYTGMPVGSMYGLMGNYCPFVVGNSQQSMVGPLKEVITLPRCVLYRNPNTPPPTPQSNHFGCKTVYVRDLPGKVTEEIVKDVFETCGTILKIQMVKKTSYHIRFATEAFVERALSLSGYKIVIEKKNDSAHTGYLHVDYAKDDHIECKQALDLGDKNLQQIGDVYLKALSPSYVHYTEDEVDNIKKKLQKEETFQQALTVFISWLENGECTKKTASNFYSMLQIANTHVRDLMHAKGKYDEEVHKAKLMLQNQIESSLTEFQKIEKVFNTASLQKVWDHFTKAQRRHIEDWKKQTQEAKSVHSEELLKDRIEDEMELSEDDETSSMKTSDASEEQNNKLKKKRNLLKEENDTLRCRLEALENEKIILKSDTAQELAKIENQMQLLKHASQNAEKLKMLNDNSKRSMDANENQTDKTAHCSTVTTVEEGHACLISLISTFLSVHPYGATIDYIYSYLSQMEKITFELRYVENLMRCYPLVFKEISHGVGASLVKKWMYLGFQT